MIQFKNLQKEINQNEERNILFVDSEPDIQFILQEKNESEYTLKPNIDIYSYALLIVVVYLLIDLVLYILKEKFIKIDK